MPIWYDLILILSFAWTALLFGFLSLMKLEEIARQKFSSTKVNLMVIFLLFAASFGVYLGRFLRWNSWDIAAHPFGLLADILDRFKDPFSHQRTWGLTLLMGTFLSLVYFSFRFIKVNTKEAMK
ncbi:hypothetical protein EMGBS15_10440 [Filimonas sp.]|jgi:hypothetical protein|nr:hypothetical protein EMGBS15_10440 [Filimonas sp.]